MRHLLVAVALVAMACSGGDETESTPAVASAAAPAGSVTGESEAVGAVHEIQMVLTDQGEYRYVPDQLTIKVGDTVRWINVSGGPHNVQFKADQIPSGAAAVLNAAMANRIGELNGELLIAPDATYEISFAGAPAGAYGYVCTPHELLGMIASLTVEQ